MEEQKTGSSPPDPQLFLSSTPPLPAHPELAGARAASVVRLFEHSGLSTKRLLAVSMADVKPVASNATPEGRAKNRRIEIRLRPIPLED